MPKKDLHVKLDLNNTIFQEQLFSLPKDKQLLILKTFRKLSKMTWSQVYNDNGLNWEMISSIKGPNGNNLNSLRIDKKFRAVAYRDKQWMRMLTLHPDHDSAYKNK